MFSGSDLGNRLFAAFASLAISAVILANVIAPASPAPGVFA